MNFYCKPCDCIVWHDDGILAHTKQFHDDAEYNLVSGLSYADLDPTMHDGDGDY